MLFTCACGAVSQFRKAPDRIKCLCGLLTTSPTLSDGEPIKTANVQCRYRSEEFRLEPCPSCKGSVLIKVFKCEKHGECTMAKSLRGIHRCDCAY
jgi:hypothetical protein